MKDFRKMSYSTNDLSNISPHEVKINLNSLNEEYAVSHNPTPVNENYSDNKIHAANSPKETVLKKDNQVLIDTENESNKNQNNIGNLIQKNILPVEKPMVDIQSEKTTGLKLLRMASSCFYC